MKCFYHHDADAVGTCKWCGKGLCTECAVDLDKGLACKDRCEAQARQLITLIDNNLEMSAKGLALTRNMRKNSFVQAAWIGGIGALFFLVELLSNKPTYFMGGLGVLFFIYGAYLFWRGVTFPK